MTKQGSLLTSTALTGALAVVGLGLSTGSALAFTSVYNAAADTTLATQSVTATNGLVTLSGGASAQTLILTSQGAGDNCPTGSTITLTAPTGTTFASAPNAAINGGGTLTATGFAAGNSSVVYTVGATSVSNGGSVTFGGAAGPITLNTGSTFTSAVATSVKFNVTQNGCNVATTFAAATGTGIASASAFSLNRAAGTTRSVDTTATGQGKSFVTATGVSARVATLGTAQYTVATNLVNAAGGATFTAAGTTGNVTISGPVGQLSRIYLASSCNTTAGGAIPTGGLLGTISGSSASFAGMVDGTTYTLCVENNGTSVIQLSTPTGTNYFAVGTSSSLTGSDSSTATTVGTLAYSGTSTALNYLTGGSAYQYFVRAVNPNTASTAVFVVVTKDDGSVFSGTITTNLGANAAALYSVTDLNTATGANLTAADRARVQVLLNAGANAGGILYNTATGVVTLSN